MSSGWHKRSATLAALPPLVLPPEEEIRLEAKGAERRSESEPAY
jgi:hypothetical protein